jgi:hypothetical protein
MRMREKGKKNLKHILEMGEQGKKRIVKPGAFSASSDNELRREFYILTFEIQHNLRVRHNMLHATSNTTNVPSSIQRLPG